MPPNLPLAEPTRVLVIRHGQTAWNADARIQGHTDIGLDAVGAWQDIISAFVPPAELTCRRAVQSAVSD